METGFVRSRSVQGATKLEGASVTSPSSSTEEIGIELGDGSA